MENTPGPAELTLNYPARSQALEAALDAIEQACSAWKVNKELLSRTRIVVEELFSNTIKYGYGGECERPVRLSLRATSGLTLVYEDEAPAFNPLAWKGPSDEAPPQDRPIGQAGIAMVRGLCAQALYQRRGRTNRLTMTFEQP